MKVLAPAILFFEALLVALAIPVAVVADGKGPGAAWVLAVVALALLLAAGMARRPRGVTVGWVLQGVVLATGLLVPAMLAVGLIFLAVWIVAVVYGGKADRIAAERSAQRDVPHAGTSAPPSGADGGSSDAR